MKHSEPSEKKTGILLINLGSPASPKTGAIRSYLREFLSDPRVMTMPTLVRWIILYCFILPFRPGKIKEKYEKIWEADGFPLIKHNRALADKISLLTGKNYLVEPVMRYGLPSIESGLNRFKKAGIEKLIVLPLFPQYSSATSGSILEKVMAVIKKWDTIPQTTVIPYFYHHPSYISVCVSIGKEYWKKNPDHVLFSFHGLPESHILKADSTHHHCLKEDHCCDVISNTNSACYRAQCVQTAMAVARKLDIPVQKYTISFQSRLGRSAWLGPYTSDTVAQLAQSGAKHLLVFCLSFVADCLETTEEILVEEKKNFINNGGENLVLVPSLNSSQDWAEAVIDILSESISF